MLYEKITEMWLQRAANIPPKYKMFKGQSFLCSIDKSYPVRMMMKIKRLKFINK